jgi:beta-galactosidase
MSEDLELVFPKDFLWGTATAAYQIEGAVSKDGRTPSIWDTFSATPGKVVNGETGAVACDHYHRFKDDIKLMKELGFSCYRMSISWSRVLPHGRGDVNPAGLAFYDALIDELVSNNIKPLVTLYHWDLPQCLEDEYEGWLGKQVVDDFMAYSAVCFEHFGDRVKHWITLNEPWCSSALGYANGEHAPGRKDNAGTEPYIAAHHMNLAHASAVKKYRTDFKTAQGGAIGLTVNMDWKEPYTTSDADVAAAQRALDWQMGLFVDPIYYGDYPESMRKCCGDRLPTFTDEEKKLIKGSNDFFGLNHYSTDYVKSPEEGEVMLSMWGTEQKDGYFEDQRCMNVSDPRWQKTDMGWDVVPWGLKNVLLYIQRKYNPEGGIIVTENGCAVKEDDVRDAENDAFRVNYFKQYLAQVHEAISEGADVRGYFAWSMLDNFEWSLGYSKRFGIVHVDYDTQVRTAKASAKMMGKLAQTNMLSISKSMAAAAKQTPRSDANSDAKRAKVA